MAISFVSSVVSNIEQVQEMKLSNEEITEADNVSSVVSSIEQVQEMELSNEEITEADNICLYNCILWPNFLLSLLFRLL